MAKSAVLLRPILPASQLRQREEFSCYPSLDILRLKPLLPNGLTPGTIMQLQGLRSSGRTTLAAHILAQSTARGEVCAVVDVQGQLNPASLQASGIALEQLVWIRCNGNAEQAFKAIDLLLHAGGFGLVWLDLCEVPAKAVQRIPLSYWYRFSRTIENTCTTLLINSDKACVKYPVNNYLQIKSNVRDWLQTPGVFQGIQSHVTLQKNTISCPLHLQAIA